MNRRSLILGLTGALAAPAIVRAESLMKLWVPPAPKFITQSDTRVLTGQLYNADGLVVGKWTEKNGYFDFRWDDPKPTGHYINATNHDFRTYTEVLKVYDATPYWPRPRA